MPKIVTLGLTPNRATIEDIEAALLRAPNFLASLGLHSEDGRTLPLEQLGLGHYAHAFLLPDGRVLKVTDDEDDARVCKLILDHGNGKPGLPYIQSVHRLPGDVYENETDVSVERPLFAIVMEPVTVASKTGMSRTFAGVRSRILGEAVFYPSEESQLPNDEARAFVKVIRSGVHWLGAHGVGVVDLHHGNLGYASGKRPVIIDFGHGSLQAGFKMKPIKMATNPDLRPRGMNATGAKNAHGNMKVFNSVGELNRWLETTPLSPIKKQVSGKIGYLSNLEVPAEERGRGAGTAAARSLIEDARQQGVRYVFLHAADPWSHSTWRQVQFWGDKLGFTKMPYDDGSYHAPPMVLDLGEAPGAMKKNARKMAMNPRVEYGYHATSHAALPRIAAEGILPRNEAGSRGEDRAHDGPAVFFSLKRDSAAAWGPVVLRFPLSVLAEFYEDEYGDTVIFDDGTVGRTNYWTPDAIPADVLEYPVGGKDKWRKLTERYGMVPNAKKQRHAAEVGLDWTKPDTWPDSIEHRQFAHDFRVLLEDHEFIKPSYDIVRIRLDDVTVPEIDYDDDRDLNPDTGEPSDAYMDGLVIAMRSGMRMPPAVVGNVDEDEGRSTPWGHPYDGRHRLNAAKRLGLKWFPAIDVTRTGEDVMPNGRSMPKVRAAFDECFDALVEQFPDFGDLELHHDEKAGSDNGAGSERQFGYCTDGKPIRVAFASKAEELPRENIIGLMRHEFGHALDYRYGKALGKMLGRRLPDGVERRADAIAEAVFGEPIEYDERLIQCIDCGGASPRPRRLPK